MKILKLFISNFFIVLVVSLYPLYIVAAENNDWRKSGIVQSYLQSYSGDTTRTLDFNAGAYLNMDYLDSGGVSLGYNYTFADFDNDADLTEHLFYGSGRHHVYMDTLPGKMTLRFDAYFGEDTLRYNINNPPDPISGGHMGGGGMSGGSGGGGSSFASESTDIVVYQPILAYSNFAKTFYVDIGYAHSEYSGTSDIDVDQLSPTAGFGWNESYDWLQIRGYFIELNHSVPAVDDDQFESIEIKYTHWFPDSNGTATEFWRLSGVFGERLLAVDPDAAVVYSISDKQTASLSASIQWKLSTTNRLLMLLNYNQYENISVNNDYDSILLYLNLQQQW